MHRPGTHRVLLRLGDVGPAAVFGDAAPAPGPGLKPAVLDTTAGGGALDAGFAVAPDSICLLQQALRYAAAALLVTRAGV